MLTVKTIEQEKVVSFDNTHRLSIANAQSLEEELLSFVMQSKSNLTVDFSGVNFIDSYGFDIFKNVSKKLTENKIHFNFINLSDELKELVELLKLETVFYLN
ncbi:MAG: STAS domain-containing protein [Bacteroidales bacterium]|nr:STAS domain-containing protein [Bacteroidales bacterium]